MKKQKKAHPKIFAQKPRVRKSPAEILNKAMNAGGKASLAKSLGAPKQQGPRACVIIRVNPDIRKIYAFESPITPEVIQKLTGMEKPRGEKLADGDDGFQIHVAGNDDVDSTALAWMLEGCTNTLRGPAVIYAVKDAKVTSLPENVTEQWVKERITWL